MILKDTLREVARKQMGSVLSRDSGTAREALSSLKAPSGFACVVSGIRRCGKSTLLRQAMSSEKGFYYFNFEDPRAAGFSLEDFPRLDAAFREEFGEHETYFFDEIQNVEKWELFVRAGLDDGKRFFITGSNASLLSRELGTRLTGRHIRHELYPFSYPEFLSFSGGKAGKESFLSYLQSGGFPEYLKSGQKEVLNELFNDIISRDIVVRHGIRSARALREMALFLVSNIGKEFSYNKLASSFGLGSANTAADFASFLEDAYIVFQVPKFDYSLRKQVANQKKAYCVDNGLSSANSASFSSDLGRLLENHVFLSLKRAGLEAFYFRGKGECDFIARNPKNSLFAFQSCLELNEENKERELSGLVEAMDGLKLSSGTIVTLAQEDSFTLKGKRVRVVPAWKWKP